MAKSHNTVKVIIRKELLNKSKSAPICLQCFINGKRKVISVGVSVEIAHFNADTEKVTIPKNADETRKLNALIEKKKSEVNDIFFKAAYDGTSLSIDLFNRQINKKLNTDSFTDFIVKESELLEGQLAKDTIKGYSISLKYFRAYAKKDNISFIDINQEWVEGFDKWLKAKKLDTNTRHKHHKNVKKFINLAILRSINVVNPYLKYKVKKAKTTPDWLTPEELGKLVELYNARTLRIEWQRVLRYFLFSCVCGGLRISDLANIQANNKIGDMLVFRAQKTKETNVSVTVPFSEVGLNLWNDNIGRESKKVFGCLTDQRSNDVIKKVSRMAGIDKHVTMHVARHTFATSYIIIGGRVEMLQDILGHSKLETTQIYLHLAQAYTQKRSDMQNFDKLFKIEPYKPILKKIVG